MIDCPDGKRIEKKIDMLHSTISGNGEMGVAEMARRAFRYMNRMEATRNSWTTWVFRLVILIILSYIGIKVGGP